MDICDSPAALSDSFGRILGWVCQRQPIECDQQVSAKAFVEESSLHRVVFGRFGWFGKIIDDEGVDIGCSARETRLGR
jgi:hypothetical protein